MKMELKELNDSLAEHDLSGFWNTRTPEHQDEAPYLWKWREVYPVSHGRQGVRGS